MPHSNSFVAIYDGVMLSIGILVHGKKSTLALMARREEVGSIHRLGWVKMR